MIGIFWGIACIAHSSCEWKLKLYICELESVKLFLRAINLQQDQFQLRGKIKEMWFRNDDEPDPDPAIAHLLVDNMPQLSVFHNMTHLGLECCSLTSETCNLLSKCNLQHFEYLNLWCNPNIGRGGAVNLITSLTKFSTIRELNLTCTCIGFEDCKALSELLATSKCIEVLVICDEVHVGPDEFILSSDSVQLIVDGLSRNTSLEKLHMSSSNFSSESVFQLASVLRVNTRLKELNIGQCNIQSSDSVHLAKALEENITTQLQTLGLHFNPIGSEGSVAFADMLATNKSLTELNMRECSIWGEGVVCLAKAFEKNSTLKKFSITHNPIGSEGAVAFAGMLATNKSLTELDMWGCNIQGEGTVSLVKALETNSTVREFHISFNPIGSEGAVAFADMLATDKSLTEVSMRQCDIQKEDAAAFASMLKKNQCLKTLNLYDNNVGVKGALELIESLKHNTTLEKLVLSPQYKPSSFSTLYKTLQDRVKF